MPAGESDKPFVIHEWGTFTVLQDEAGETLPGVNLNEETLPPFVFRLNPGLVSEGYSHNPLLRPYSKGLPSRLLLARMRMETPVIYIYPPTDQPQEIDVRVEFQGGWISEWFPHADVTAPGLDNSSSHLGTLSRDSRGSIFWKNLTTNSDRPLKETSQHVWLAPREVQAPALHATGNQAEKYLFYRGVANIEAPLRMQHDSDWNAYRIVRNQSLGSWEYGLHYRAMWLVDIPETGQAAYRRIDLSHQHSADDTVSTCASEFSERDCSAENLERLKAEMKQSLVAEGLYEDEAAAMLKTWELSYFKSPGRRLFFTLPRDWTDRVLPLEVSRTSEIERVMIGRIELITGRHRRLLDRLNNAAISKPDWFYTRFDGLDPEKRNHVYNSLANGTKQVTDFDFDVPDDFRTYLKLGRFREALISDAARNEDAKGIRQFAENYGIRLK
jgi:hypothetical protein